MMVDPETGSKVEIDIVIETEVSGIPLFIGIECTAKKRPANLEWYRQLIQKHHDLGIAKTVLVSKSGFTKDVYKKADLKKVTLLTLEEAEDTDWIKWAKKINNGSMVNVGFQPTSFELSVDEESLVTPNFFQINHKSMIKVNDDVLSIRQYIIHLLQASGITRKILEMSKDIPEECRNFEVTFEERGKVRAFLPNGSFVTFSKIKVAVDFEIKTTGVQVRSGVYNNRNIAYAEVKNIMSNHKSDCFLTFVQDANGKLEGQFSYKKNDGTDVSLPMDFVEKHPTSA
jgi:hypothetical protein